MIADLAGRTYPHGTRARYNAQKCRCTECRRANSEYEKSRYRDPRVPADAARAHLLALSAAGVGRDAVADACDITPNAVTRITSRTNDKIRRSLEVKILTVDASARADHSLVDGAETRRLIREIIAEGYRRRHIGHDLINVHYRDRGMVTAITALRVRKLHAALLAEDDGDDVFVLDETPRARILSALRHFDWVEARDLFDGMEVSAVDRNTYAVTIGRLARDGAIDRRGERHPFEYRSKP